MSVIAILLLRTEGRVRSFHTAWVTSGCRRQRSDRSAFSPDAGFEFRPPRLIGLAGPNQPKAATSSARSTRRHGRCIPSEDASPSPNPLNAINAEATHHLIGEGRVRVPLRRMHSPPIAFAENRQRNAKLQPPGVPPAFAVSGISPGGGVQRVNWVLRQFST